MFTVVIIIFHAIFKRLAIGITHFFNFTIVSSIFFTDDFAIARFQGFDTIFVTIRNLIDFIIMAFL
ncbi:hypothetical protein D3C87_1668380 [compost metagenome]